MNIQHKTLADGRWAQMSFCEQMANVGAEVGRALNWKNKGKDQLSTNAFYRSLELLDLTISCCPKKSYLKELCRLRECLVDFFYGSNEYSSTDQSWRKYFDPFNYAARRNL